MLRYDRQTKPGLVALYDIRPGNGAGPFLQPRSLHGALMKRKMIIRVICDQLLLIPVLYTTTFSFCLTGLYLCGVLQVRVGPL